MKKIFELCMLTCLLFSSKLVVGAFPFDLDGNPIAAYQPKPKRLYLHPLSYHGSEIKPSALDRLNNELLKLFEENNPVPIAEIKRLLTRGARPLEAINKTYETPFTLSVKKGDLKALMTLTEEMIRLEEVHRLQKPHIETVVPLLFYTAYQGQVECLAYLIEVFEAHRLDTKQKFKDACLKLWVKFGIKTKANPKFGAVVPTGLEHLACLELLGECPDCARS